VDLAEHVVFRSGVLEATKTPHDGGLAVGVAAVDAIAVVEIDMNLVGVLRPLFSGR
jgi:hypothetical protein